MKLEKAIGQVLAKRTIKDIFEAIDAIKKKAKIKQSDDFIADAIESYFLDTGCTDICIDYNQEELVYREQLFANTAFRIQLTEDEIKTKRLIFGHRFQPFIHPNVHPQDIFLIDDADNEMELFEELGAFVDNIIYFSLLPPYGLMHYNLDNDGNIPIMAFDLSDWIARNKFTSKDNILITPIDYDKKIFRIEKLSSRDINTQKIVTQKKDVALVELIIEEIETEGAILPVDMLLFRAMAQLNRDFLSQMGTPLGVIISDHEEIQIFNNGAYSYLNTQENMDRTFDMAADQAMSPSIEDMGRATDLQGIFNEMGISYTEDFVIGKMIEQIHNKQSIDESEIRNLVLKNGNASFYNSAQNKNFDKALKKLVKNVTKDWKTERLPLPAQQLLSQTLKMKMEVIGLLRQIDDKLTDPSSFDFNLLMPLQPFEHLTDGLLRLLTTDEEKPINLMKDMSKQVKYMREEFAQMSQEILAQIR